MNKKLFLIAVIVSLALTIVTALAYDEDGTDYNGDPNYNFGYDTLDFIDKIYSVTPGLNAFKISSIDGAMCSASPDYSKQSKLNYNSVCWNNVNGGSPGGSGKAHTGVVYSVHEIVKDKNGIVTGWKLIDQISIKKNQKKCVSITSGKEYHRSAWYCDAVEQQKTCSNWEYLCTVDGKQTRERRKCIEGGKTNYEYANVDWINFGVTGKLPDCDGKTPPEPKEEYCGNNVCDNGETSSTCSQDCKSTSVCGNNVCEKSETSESCPGDCTTKPKPIPTPTPEPTPNPEDPEDPEDPEPTPEPTPNGLNGKFSNYAIPPNVEVGKDFNLMARFTADNPGLYYLEAGIEEKPLALAIVTATGSKCDSSEYFAGEFVELEKGESVDLVFKIKSRDTPGEYGLVFGAYTGCLKSDKNPQYDGEIIKKEGKSINVVGEGEEPTPVNSGINYLWVGLFLIVLGIIMAYPLGWIYPALISIAIGVILSLLAL